MRFRTKQKKKVMINITSLIDVLFLLLIFFMVSSTFLEQPGIKLELPEAQSAAVIEQKEYTLFLNKDGKMYLNNDEVSFNDLEDELKLVLSEMKDNSLILKADRDVAHGIVVRMMDIVKKSGVKRLVIGTKLE